MVGWGRVGWCRVEWGVWREGCWGGVGRERGARGDVMYVVEVGVALLASLAAGLRVRNTATTLMYGGRRANDLFDLDECRQLGVGLEVATEDDDLLRQLAASDLGDHVR